jgi:hypothetical protein
MHTIRFAPFFALVLVTLGCADSSRPTISTAVEARPAIPAPAPAAPEEALPEQPAPAATDEAQPSRGPQFAVSRPHGWKVEEPLIGTSLLLSNDKADAVIIMDRSTVAVGTAADECAALIRYFGEDRRNRFSAIRVDGDRSASFDMWGTSWRGTRYGTITVMRYGKDGKVSVVYRGFWPKRSLRSSKADYDDFVRGVTLTKE